VRSPVVKRATHVLRVPQVRALREAEQEHCYVLGLDAGHHVTVVHLVSVGTVDIAYPHARDVFRELIRHNCVKFVFVHNHPGGHTGPSDGDRDVTAWLRHAGEWLGIPLVAHVLVPGRRGCPVDVGPPLEAPDRSRTEPAGMRGCQRGGRSAHELPHEPLP